MKMQDTSLLDYLIIIIYLSFVFFLAIQSKKKEGQVSEKTQDLANRQYLANKKVTFWESLCSIVATEVSALTFLGIPAIAFKSDFSFIHIYIGAFFGRIIIAQYFIPKIYNKGLTIYQIMNEADIIDGNNRGERHLSGQTASSLIFFVSKMLAVGVRLFSGSILVAQFFNLNIYIAIAGISLLTFIYTFIGGLKAVVRTDQFQMALFICGGVTAHFLIPHIDGRDWWQLMEQASLAGKTHWISFDSFNSFIVGVLGGFLFDMATHGVDQDIVQRLLATKNQKLAQKSILFSAFPSLLVGFLFLSVGSLLWSFYQGHPLPKNMTPDFLFGHFITSYFPSPLKGLMVAGVLAATMSTLDSTINALSSCLWNDIFKNRSLKKIQFYAKLDSFFVTFLLTLIAFLASHSQGLLLLGLKITSWTAGTFLALFFNTLLWKGIFGVQLNFKSVFGAYIFGLIGVYINVFVLSWPWQWNIYFGLVFSLIFFKIYKILNEKKPT